MARKSATSVTGFGCKMLRKLLLDNRFVMFMPVANRNHRHTFMYSKHYTNINAYRHLSDVMYLSRGENSVAYHKVDRVCSTTTEGDAHKRDVNTPSLQPPGIVFLPGFQSNMDGEKAKAIAGYCTKNNLECIRFDYQGCGSSGGDFARMTLTDWKADVLAVLDQLTSGPQILVGSSMGGWLMTYAALQRPSRIHALIGIAISADFPQKIYTKLPRGVLESLQKAGCMEVSWRNRTYIVTRQFHDDLRDGGHDDFLASEGCDTMPVAAPIEVPVAAPVAAPIAVPVTAPVRLLHGMRDDTVLVDVPSRFLARLASQDVRLTLVKDADHQFSRPADITLMCNTLDSLL